MKKLLFILCFFIASMTLCSCGEANKTTQEVQINYKFEKNSYEVGIDEEVSMKPVLYMQGMRFISSDESTLSYQCYIIGRGAIFKGVKEGTATVYIEYKGKKSSDYYEVKVINTNTTEYKAKAGLEKWFKARTQTPSSYDVTYYTGTTDGDNQIYYYGTYTYLGNMYVAGPFSYSPDTKSLGPGFDAGILNYMIENNQIKESGKLKK